MKPYIVHVIANYLDIGQGLTVTTVMPQNLQYETQGDVVALMKEAQPVAGSAAMRIYARNLIMRMNQDDPDGTKKALVMEDFNPFSGMDQATIMQMINGGQALEESAVMWTESATIFAKAEQEYEDKPIGFYDLPTRKQREVVYRIRDEIIAKKKETAQANQATFGLGVDPQLDPDGTDQADIMANESAVV